MLLAIVVAQALDRRSAIVVFGPAAYTEAKAHYRGLLKGELPLYDQAAEYPNLEVWTEGGKHKSQRLHKDQIAEAEAKAAEAVKKKAPAKKKPAKSEMAADAPDAPDPDEEES